MNIDIRNPIFEIRELVDAAIEMAMVQVKAGIREIAAKYDLDLISEREACANEVRAFVAKEMNHINGATHMTDSVEGFINAQVVRKLVGMVANPESEILMAHFGA